MIFSAAWFRQAGTLALVICTGIFGTALYAQGVVITAPVTAPAQTPVKQFSLRNWGVLDTLALPFFDDFTSTEGIPDRRRWTGRQVYVNRTFSEVAPTFGVATFDHLNENGRTWTPINPGRQVACDTLTSQPINLLNYRSGLNTVQYRPIDSVYLSFFFQSKGLGDLPELSDSLVLQFKKSDGNWEVVWLARGGRNMPAFRQVMLPLIRTEFFHAAFQFRFINYSMATGNLNHWHLDYVRMNRNRSYNDTAIRDVAISAVPRSFMARYQSMPYRQFMANPAKETRQAHELRLRNLGGTTVQTQLQFIARDAAGTIVAQSPFASNNRNVLAGDDTTERFAPFALNGLPGGDTPWVDIEYRINPLSNDQTPGLYNAPGDNNRINSRLRFQPWLAYDDGSAEGGFGLDYAFLGNIRAQCAIRYELNQRDTLRGMAIYFNRSREDVSSRPFTLCIWRKVSEPPALTDRGDEIIYTLNVARPVYSDSLQRFSFFMFDTALVLNAGTFYIGWRQTAPFILNTGYDINYKVGDSASRNPHIFYNFLGRWEAVPSDVTGAPMIRPLLGSRREFTFSRQEQAAPGRLDVYPNPVQAGELIRFRQSDQLVVWELRENSGRTVAKGLVNEQSIRIPEYLSAGTYLLQGRSRSGAILYQKIQIN